MKSYFAIIALRCPLLPARRLLRCSPFLCCVMLFFAGPAGADVNIDQAWLNAHGPAPYYLDQAGTTYILGTDITTEGSAIGIIADNVTFDLNGHTITYDNAAPVAVQNGSFENGQTGWDFSQAPNAVVSQGTFVMPVSVYDGNYALKFNLPVSDQQIRSSGTVTLQPNTTYSFSAMFYSPDYPNNTVTLYAQLEGTSVRLEQTGTNWRGFQYTYATYRTGASPETYHIVLGISGASTMAGGTKSYIDDIRIQRYAAHGVVVGPVGWRDFFPDYTRYGWTSGCVVKNGTIVQGPGGATAGSALVVGENDSNHELANLTITAHGANSLNIVGGHGSRIHHNTLFNNVTTIRSRDNYDGTVLSGGGVGTEIYNNTIEGGCQNGIVFSGGNAANPVKVHDNTIALKSKYTNGFAINSYALKYAEIYSNTINCGEGDYAARGIASVGNSENVKIYNNTIKVQELPRNQEYNGGQGGTLSGGYGIQVEESNNIEIYGNDVTAYATLWSAQAMRTNFALTNRNINVHDNIFRAVRNSSSTDEPNLHAASLKIDGGIDTPNLQLIFRNNTLISNDRWLSCSALKNLDLTGNTFAIGDNPVQPFQPLVANRYYANTRDVEPIEQIRFLDNHYSNAAARTAFEGSSIYVKYYVNMGVDPLSSFRASYTYSLTVVDANGAAIPGAAVSIRTNSGSQVFSGTTDAAGKIETVLNQLYNNGGVKTYYNPYTVTVTAPAGTFTQGFSINQPMQVNFTAAYNSEAPAAPQGLRVTR